MQFDNNKFLEKISEKRFQQAFERRSLVSVDDMAKQCGVHRSKLNRIVNGQLPSTTDFTLLCTWLNTPASEFIY